jgi:hypothetical protein
MDTHTTPLTVRETLDNYYEKNNLGENGGLNNSWAWLKAGWFYIPIPNPASRKKVIIFHDIHHLATGYQTNWKGEAEIGAWEVSSGCEDYAAAWVLDSMTFAYGVVFFPFATYRAFIRGRRTSNLYKHIYTNEQLMTMSIPEIQSKLMLDKPQTGPATTREIISFAGWVAALAGAFLILFILPCVILACLLMR